MKLIWHDKVILTEFRKPAFSKNLINGNIYAASFCLLAVYDDFSIEANQSKMKEAKKIAVDKIDKWQRLCTFHT